MVPKGLILVADPSRAGSRSIGCRATALQPVANVPIVCQVDGGSLKWPTSRPVADMLRFDH